MIFAQLQIVDFDTDAEQLHRSRRPVRIQFSPNQKFDIGLEFTLLNIKPPEGRNLVSTTGSSTLFVQSRFGR